MVGTKQPFQQVRPGHQGLSCSRGAGLDRQVDLPGRSDCGTDIARQPGDLGQQRSPPHEQLVVQSDTR
jgi:hypothetical protein